MDNTLKSILTTVGIILLILLLWSIRSIIAYIMIAAALSLIGKPIVQRLNNIRIKKRSIPRAVSALLTLLLMYAVVISSIIMLFPILSHQADSLAMMEFDSLLAKFIQPIEDMENWLIQRNMIDASGDLQQIFNERILSFLSLVKVSDAFNLLLSFAGSVFIGIFAVTFITFFFLRDDRLFIKGVMAITPDHYQNEVRSILSKSRRLLTRYFIGLTFDITLVCTLFTIGLWIIGVENALFIGVFAGIMNIVPYLGPIIGATVGILLGIASMPDMDLYTEMLPLILKMLAVFLTVNLLDASVFQPNIYANSVKAHPLEIFLVILIAATIAGVPGMIFAIPAYSFFRIIAKEFLSESKIVRSITRNI